MMKKTNFFQRFVETCRTASLLCAMTLATMGAMAQVTIGSGNLPSDWSLLDIDTSVQKKALHSPRLDNEAREDLIPSGTSNQPAEGVLIFNTETKCLEYWNGTKWISLCEGDEPMKSCVELNGVGVELNGVCWAICNVEEPGTFAATPESAGKFYQWNRKVAWDTTGETVENWNNTFSEGMEWTAENDPCPDGWRVPTLAEFQTLIDTEKVSSDLNTLNAIFTDLATGNTLFYPEWAIASAAN